MNPNSAAYETQRVNQAQNLGSTLQAQDNAGVANTQGQFNQANANANTTYGNMSNYISNLPSYRNLYQNYFKNGSSALGYNPSTTQSAANNLTAGENIMSNLPAEANQAGNYSGATAGQVAQNYQNMAGAINPMLANANHAMTNQLGMYNAANTFANNASNTAISGEQAKLGGYNNLYGDVNQQMGNIGNVLNNYVTNQQTQGTATQNQISHAQGSYANYLQSSAAANASNAQAAQTTQQVNMANQVHSLVNTIMGGNATPAQKAQAQALMDEITKTNVNMSSIYGLGKPAGTTAQKTTTPLSSVVSGSPANGSTQAGWTPGMGSDIGNFLHSWLPAISNNVV
jgi:hypothetical protein